MADKIITFKNRAELVKILIEIFPSLNNYSDLKFHRIKSPGRDIDFELLVNGKSIYMVEPEIRFDSPFKEYVNQECIIRKTNVSWEILHRKYPNLGSFYTVQDDDVIKTL